MEGTPEQLAAVSDGIRAMSLEIPSTTTEIAAVAEAAGQLGIATDDVLSFTRTMLDLGQSTKPVRRGSGQCSCEVRQHHRHGGGRLWAAGLCNRGAGQQLRDHGGGHRVHGHAAGLHGTLTG